jgi:hypothetical protein
MAGDNDTAADGPPELRPITDDAEILPGSTKPAFGGNLMTKIRGEIDRKFETGGIVDQKTVGDVTHVKYKSGWCRSLSPLDPDMRRWDLVTVLLLGFTAVVTPFEIAFLDTSVDGLFVVNRLVDLVSAL